MAKRAIISGGSIGGLFAAAALQKAGWTVDVFERTPQGLSGRGAGIVTYDALVTALEHVGADTSDIGVHVQDRVAIDQSGAVVATLSRPQKVTSWDRIHSILRRLIPDQHYHLGRHCIGYRQTPGAATALFDDGQEETADLVVAADGFRSAIRGQMQPKVQPSYAGYVVWRTLADQTALAAGPAKDIFPHFTVFAPAGTQALGYPIAGHNNDLRDGQLRYNLVWYCPVSDGQLDGMLTDDSGLRHDVSIPPPLITEGTLADMRALAQSTLPLAFQEVLDKGERPFFTPIYDLQSPVMTSGRVVLVGDAACTARPHVGMGVTKAAEDALALARHMSTGPTDQGLAAFSKTRSAASKRAHQQGQMLGSWLVEPDPDNPNGANNARMDQILDLTAALVE